MFGVAGTAPNLLSENFNPTTDFKFNKQEGNFSFAIYPSNNYEIFKTLPIEMNDVINAINGMSEEDKNNFLSRIQ